MARETKIYQTKLVSLKEMNPSVKLFRFQFSEPFHFLAGQFVMVHLKDENGKEIRRAYSIASSPKNTDYIELCIRRVNGGSATSILHELKEGDTVPVSEPLGKFSLDENIQRDVVFIAGGTGIAPIRSMLQTLPIPKLKNQFWLFFGINTLDDFLFRDEIETLAKSSNFKLVLVVANDPRWKGPTGYISKEVISQSLPNLDNHEIYMCGPPPMIRFVKGYLPELGAKPELIHIDAWE